MFSDLARVVLGYPPRPAFDRMAVGPWWVLVGDLAIPMPGQAESLNAATAAAIVLFEALRQRADG